MEQELINYIKNMFAMESTPTWLPDYEGVIFYDKAAKKWVTGTDVGWKVINRSQATVSGIAPIDWIDPFEYENNTALSGTYTVSDNSLVVSVDSTTSTYGNYSMKIDTSSTISGTSIIRNFNPPLAVISDYISFDVKSDTIIDDSVDVLFINSELVNPTILYGARRAKSVVFDCFDRWAIDAGYTAVRSIDFWYKGSKIEVTSGFTAYATSKFSSSYEAWMAFNTSLPKIGTYSNYEWLTTATSNQRLIIVFDSEIVFDTIIVNNSHDVHIPKGGIKNVKIYVSSDAITNTTYGADIPNSNLIFDGQIAAHVAADVIDDQELALIPEDYFTLTSGIFVPTINITDIDTYQKQSFFIADATLSGSIDYLKLVITKPGPIYNIDNMRFDSDRETYWLDVCEYNIDDDVQAVYKTTASGLVVATTDAMVAYGNKAIHISANTMASGVSIYRPFIIYSGGYVAAKSVIFDIADNWGDPTFIGLRAVDFYKDGSLLDVLATDIQTYQTNAYSSSYDAAKVFNTSLSKTGAILGTSWQTYNGVIANQRLCCVFNSSIEFDTIKVNNYHISGGYTARGCKSIEISVSNDSVIDTTYGAAITNSTLIFEGQINQHTALDQIDDQTIDVSSPISVISTSKVPPTNTLLFDMASDRLGENLYFSLEYTVRTYIVKSVIFDFANNYGGARQAIRAIEFYINGVLLEMIDNFTGYVTSYYNHEWQSSAAMAFNTTLSKIGGDSGNAWVAGSSSNQRLVIVFDSVVEFDTMVIYNAHNSGGGTTQGVKNTKIYISSDEITSVLYNEVVTNSDLIFDGIFPIHASLNIEDPQTVELVGDIGALTKTIPLNVVGINKFRTYSMDVSDVPAIDKLYFTVENSDVVTNYYIDNMRFY